MDILLISLGTMCSYPYLRILETKVIPTRVDR